MFVLSNKPDLTSLEKRKLTEAEIEDIKKEIKRFEQHKIKWDSADTYLLPLVMAFIFYLIFQKELYGIVLGFFLGLIPFGILPYFIKGDSVLLKKDLEDGFARIKTGPLYIEEIDAKKVSGQHGFYMKRYLVDELIVDAELERHSEKYSSLKDGDIMRVEFSPYAQWIFKLEKLD